MTKPILLCCMTASIVAWSSAAQAQLTYGPILGRGTTGDKMLVHWGTAASITPTVQFRVKGTSAFTTVTGAGSCSGGNCDWEAPLSGLVAAGAYEYQVQNDSKIHELRACPAAGAPMDVVFYGDSRDGEQEHQKIVAGALAQMPDMVFESGDIQADGTYAGYLTNFFVSAAPLLPTVPFMAAPGNHDASSNLATNYGRLFPTAGRTLGDPNWQPYYAFTCGNSMFIGLNSNSVSASDAQATFLNAQLAAAKADATVDHVFVWFHHPPYSPGEHGDDTGVQAAWVPLFEAAGSKVTAVFSGHDHIYAHMNDGSPVAYFVSGGAGAPPYNLTSTSKAMTVKAVGGATEYNFIKVHIAGVSVHATAYDDAGGVVEQWDNGQSGGGGGGGGGGGSGGSGGGSGGGGSGGGSGGTGGSGGSGGGGTGGSGGGNGVAGGPNGHGGGGCSMGGAALGGGPALLLVATLGLAFRRRRR